MVSVSKARELISYNSIPFRIMKMSIMEAAGCLLAEMVLSPLDTPPFNQSAMDGYTFSFDAWDKKSKLTIVGEVPAGSYSNYALKPGEAFRIFTGAALPPGADTVIMQEKVSARGKSLKIKDENIQKGANVRLKASQSKKGDVVLGAGQLLTPPAISFLASLGIGKVQVLSNPAVSIIVTGNELIAPGDKLKKGEIFESNSFGLRAALAQLSITNVSVKVVGDDIGHIRVAIMDQLNADIIILTGGVSVGNYDFVAGALKQCGVKKVFHQVKQKPGKPFYFGVHNRTMVFGLPGNPASVMACFYEYVVPCISNFTGKEYFRELEMPLESEHKKKPGLTHFLKGKTGLDHVTILADQESYKMNSFALADCLIELEEEKEIIRKGEMVKVRMII